MLNTTNYQEKAAGNFVRKCRYIKATCEITYLYTNYTKRFSLRYIMIISILYFAQQHFLFKDSHESKVRMFICLSEMMVPKMH